MTFKDEKRNKKLYTNLFRKFKYSYKSLDWGSKKNQLLRFEILDEIGNLKGKKILDVGCGFGDFLIWLRNKNIKVDYTGIDLVEGFLETAKKKSKKNKFICGNILNKKFFKKNKFNYVFASVIFTHYSLKNSEKTMFQILKRMWDLSSEGIAFNFLGNNVKKKFPFEFSIDSKSVVKNCCKLSKKMILKKNYLQNDFTIYLYR